MHYTPVPEYDPTKLDAAMEARVSLMQRAIELGRTARDNRRIGLKTPVSQVVVIAKTADQAEAILGLKEYVQDELNALEVTATTDETAWCTLAASANSFLLGKRLADKYKATEAAIAALTHDQVTAYLATGKATVNGFELGGEDILVRRVPRADRTAAYETVVSATGDLLVAVNVVLDDRLRSMGTAREICNRVQRLRKKVGLQATDSVQVYYSVAELSRAEYEEEQRKAAYSEASGEGDEDGLVGGGGAAAAGGAGAAEEKPAAKGGKKEGGKGGKEQAQKGGAKAPAPAAKGKAAPSAGATSAAEAESRARLAVVQAIVAGTATVADDPTAAIRSKAAAALHTAVVSNSALIAEAIRMPLLPDIPAARPAHAVVLGRESEVIGGAILRLVVTREALRFPTTDADLVAAVEAAPALPGAPTTPVGGSTTVHAEATLGPFGAVKPASGAAPENGPAAIVAAPALPAGTPTPAIVTAASLKSALAATDFGRQQATLAATGGFLTLNIDGKAVTVQQGLHFFTSPAAQFKDVRCKDVLAAAWADQAGEVGAKLFSLYTA